MTPDEDRKPLLRSLLDRFGRERSDSARHPPSDRRDPYEACAVLEPSGFPLSRE